MMFYVYSFLFLLLIFLIVSISYYFYDKRRRKTGFNSVFAGREPLDEAEFYESYLSDSEAPLFVLIRIRQILEEELDTDLSRLLPDDNLAETFEHFFDGDDHYDLLEAKERIEKEFGIEISDKEAAMASNIVLLVELVWQKLKELK